MAFFCDVLTPSGVGLHLALGEALLERAFVLEVVFVRDRVYPRLGEQPVFFVGFPDHLPQTIVEAVDGDAY